MPVLRVLLPMLRRFVNGLPSTSMALRSISDAIGNAVG